MLAKVLIAFGLAAVPFGLMIDGKNPPPNEPAHSIVQVENARQPLPPTTELPKWMRQPPASVPCPCCGGTPIPGTLYLNGTDNTGRVFANVPLIYHHTAPKDPQFLTYKGVIPNTIVGTIPCNVNIEYRVGLGPTIIPANAPTAELSISYQAIQISPPTGYHFAGAGMSDCGTMTFVTPALPPLPSNYPYNLVGGMRVGP